jgi:prephenate dehydratase
VSDRKLSLGALGGPDTFNGMGALQMQARYPIFAEIRYFPTSDAVVEAALSGAVDAGCAPEQMSRTGFHDGMLARMTEPGAKLHVIAETARRYGCALLVKPGTTPAQIRLVTGHNGSITHSRPWLEKHLPQAQIEIVETHSEEAARTVLASDGRVASVGSADLAARSGLAIEARDIDGGAAVNYWALSLQPLFSDKPDRLIVTGRFGDDDQLAALIGTLAEAGYLLRTACPRTIGEKLYEYDYMLRFAGAGTLADIRQRLTRFASLRLAGAWESRD